METQRTLGRIEGQLAGVKNSVTEIKESQTRIENSVHSLLISRAEHKAAARVAGALAGFIVSVILMGIGALLGFHP